MTQGCGANKGFKTFVDVIPNVLTKHDNVNIVCGVLFLDTRLNIIMCLLALKIQHTTLVQKPF